MTQEYDVQVSMNQASIVETDLVFKQGDFGFTIAIEILDFDLTGASPQIVFRKSTGAVESTTLVKAGNIYTYTFVGTELDTPGIVVCDIKLKNTTTQRISTASFMFKVESDTLNGLNEHANSYSDTIGQIWQTLQDYSETSEAWAVGTRGGVAVDTSQQQHANNSKYYAERSQNGAERSEDIYELMIASMGIGTFSFSNGKLYYNAVSGNLYNFSLSAGELYVEHV